MLILFDFLGIFWDDLESFGLRIIIPTISIVIEPDFLTQSKELNLFLNYAEFSKSLHFSWICSFNLFFKINFSNLFRIRQNKFLTNLNKV